MYRVMIVDDEPLIREGLRTLIEWENYGFQVVTVARDGNDALAQYDEAAPDLMIVDIRMPAMDGLQLMEAVRKRNIHTHYLILSGYSDFVYAKRAILSKVDGYILKPIDEEELVQYLELMRTQLDKESVAALTVNHASNIQFFNLDLQFGTEEVTIKSTDLTLYMQKLHYALDIGDKESVSLLIQEIGNDMAMTFRSEQLIKTNYIQLLATITQKLLQAQPMLRSSENKITEWISHIYDQTTFKSMQLLINVQLCKIIDHMGHNHSDTLIKRILDMIQRNYRENLKLESLAEVFNYNSAYLGKLFKNHTGDSFHTYLDKVRINKAKELLAEGLKVYQVAELVGYTNVDYFHTKFKKYVGKAPKAYQNE